MRTKPRRDACRLCGGPKTPGPGRHLCASCADARATWRSPESQARRLAYARWKAMVRRCSDPTDRSWKNYGGRGIRVCARWLDFATYLADVGYPPDPRLTVDRVDNDGDYEPDNWRWATRVQQEHNKRWRYRRALDGEQS